MGRGEGEFRALAPRWRSSTSWRDAHKFHSLRCREYIQTMGDIFHACEHQMTVLQHAIQYGMHAKRLKKHFETLNTPAFPHRENPPCRGTCTVGRSPPRSPSSQLRSAPSQPCQGRRRSGFLAPLTVNKAAKRAWELRLLLLLVLPGRKPFFRSRRWHSNRGI
jgi:hypothetical protein